MNARANLVALAERAPGIFLHLLHAQTDAPGLGINSEHDDFNRIAGADEFTRMLHALGPAHLRHVDQPFDSGFQLDKRAIVRNAGDLTIHARARWKAFVDSFPGIRQELLVSERNPFARAIKSHHLNLNAIPYIKKLTQILPSSPRLPRP